MKLLKTLSIIGIILGTLMVGVSSYFLFLDSNDEVEDIKVQIDIPVEETTNDLCEVCNDNSNIEEEIQGEKEEVYELKESGWIPNWAFNLGYESLIENKDIIDTVNPVLYTVNSSGDIISRGVSDTNIQKLLTYCKKNDIRVIPTVGSYDLTSMKNHFSSKEAYTKNINMILSEIEKYGFDGIDLDYEVINVSEKDNYLLFLKDLSTQLKLKSKILSVTVFAQWSNATYSDHQDTRTVQDYAEISKYADEVRIMAYDYTLQSSKTPGPIGPVSWIRQVLDYATKHISKEKIWLGVHLYGYEWIDNKTVALTYTSVKSILSNPNINGIFKEDLGEGYAEFGCENGQRCVMYYQNKEGVEMRRDIAKEYEIAGVSYWRLGGEEDILK
jgi:spore germination protein YaaH